MGGDDTAEGLARPFGVVLAVVVLVGLLGVGVSIARVASPATAEVDRADAIVVHAANEKRLDAGLGLARSGAAPVLVVSDIGSDYGRDDGFLQRLCARDRPVEVVCAVPEPNSTIGHWRRWQATLPPARPAGSAPCPRPARRAGSGHPGPPSFGSTTAARCVGRDTTGALEEVATCRATC